MGDVRWEMQRRSRLEIESGCVWVRVPIKTVCLSVIDESSRAASQNSRGVFRSSLRSVMASLVGFGELEFYAGFLGVDL